MIRSFCMVVAGLTAVAIGLCYPTPRNILFAFLCCETGTERVESVQQTCGEDPRDGRSSKIFTLELSFAVYKN